MFQQVVHNGTLGVVKHYVETNFLFGGDDDIKPDQSLVEAGIIDSTGVMELVSFLESRFGITVADEDLVPENLDSLARIAAFVDAKLGRA